MDYKEELLEEILILKREEAARAEAFADICMVIDSITAVIVFSVFIFMSVLSGDLFLIAIIVFIILTFPDT